MEKNLQKEILVIGHKNPDTDSICSAIAYANLKRRITNGNYKAKRAGQINSETEFVLERFKVNAPSYISDVRIQVRDIEIRKVAKVSKNISLKTAWSIMRQNNVVTLPVMDESDKLVGLITIGDIAKSYMDVYDNKILATANTPYSNIIHTLEGNMIVGDVDSILSTGKVLIAAANPDLMESYIEEGDVVILGNRYESQLCAIEMNAACIVVCEGAPVSRTITKLATDKNCTIISTPHDTYTVARLINQSIPISFFMTTDSLVIFKQDDFIEEIKGIMAKKRHRDFPVLDKHGNFLGMISRRSLLDMGRKKLILVDHNDFSQAVDGLEDTEILEIIDHHRIGTLETINPVFFRNQPLGCTSTIIYQMYNENNVEIEKHIAGLLCSAIISDTLMFRSPTCTEIDKRAVNELAKIAGIEVDAYAKEMFDAGSNLISKTPEEIFYQDFKKFTANDLAFGIGQINAMNSEELNTIKKMIIPYIEKFYAGHEVHMLFFMLTNIIDESTELLIYGNGAKEAVENAFKVKIDKDTVVLKNVVSRKKQFVPALMLALQQEQ